MAWFQQYSYLAKCDDPARIGCKEESPIRDTVEQAARAATAEGWWFGDHALNPAWCSGCASRMLVQKHREVAGH